MNVLFIGGSGNISGACVRHLCRRGDTVHVLTRGRKPVPDGCRPLVADRHDPVAMAQAVAGLEFDAVVDFLAYDVPDVDMDLNVFAGRCRQFVFISTCVVYHLPGRALPITEKTPKGNPFSEYGRRKQACEERLLEGWRRDGFPVTIVRPSHTYSESWIPNPVSSAGYTLAARIESGKPVFVHGDGQSLWTLTAADDFAVGLTGLLGNPDAIGEDFQITGDEVLTWNQIYAEIAMALHVPNPQILRIPTDFICNASPSLAGGLLGDKAHNVVFDNAKLKRAVPEFQCRVPFRDGIRKSIAWFKADPARQIVNPDVDAIFDGVADAWLKAGAGRS